MTKTVITWISFGILDIDCEPMKFRVGSSSLNFFLPNKTFIQEDLTPGKYNIEVLKPSDPGLVWRFDPFKKDILITKGKSLYFELKTSSVGLLHYVKLSPQDEISSIEKIKDLNRVSTLDKPKF